MSTLAVKKVKLGDNADTSKNFLIEVPAVADGTLTIKRENGTEVLSIGANGKAVIPGVVGTVAQVGGIPTGQIVERGSNANGEYVRFADGTQICSRSSVAVSIPGTADGSIFRSNSSTSFTFAAGFVSIPSAAFNVNSGLSFTWVGLGDQGITTTSVSISAYRATAGAFSPTVGYIAVGRWF